MSKKIHIWMKYDYPKETYFDLYSVSIALRNQEEIVNTTQPSVCNTTNLKNGYKIFVHMLDGKEVEIKLGYNNVNTDREIRCGHNLEKLLLACEFGEAAIDYK